MKYRLTNLNPGKEYGSRWVIERHTFWKGWHRLTIEDFLAARLIKDPSEFKTEAEAREGFARLQAARREWSAKFGYSAPISVDLPTEDR